MSAVLASILAAVLTPLLALGGFLAPAGTTDPVRVARVAAQALLEFEVAPTPTVVAVGVPGGQLPQPMNKLVALPGAWEPSAETVDFQWLRDGAEIPGATMFDYLVRFEDTGARISVRITASRPGYRSTPKTSESLRIAGDPQGEQEFTRAPNPELTTAGWGQVGKRIDLSLGDWEPTPDRIELEWLRDGVPIPGAVGVAYIPVAADENHNLRARVTASKPGYATTTRESFELNIAQGQWSQLAAPEIRGTVRTGELLTAHPGTWNPTPEKVTYEWRYADSPPDGTPLAVGQSYRLPEATAGRQLVVDMTLACAGYSTIEYTTDPITVPELLDFTTAPSPALSGQVRVGSAVRAVPGHWEPTPGAYAYQWLRDGQAIPGAVGSSYTPAAADLSKRLSVRVLATKPGHRATERVSAESPVLVGAAVAKRLVSTPKPKIRVSGGGAAKVGKRLIVRPGTWRPAQVKLSYRWLRNGKAIRGATKSKYRLTPKDRGKRISVRVTGKKPGYVTVAKTSSSKRVSRVR